MKNRKITFAIIAGTMALLSAALVTLSAQTVIPGLEDKIEDYYRRYPQQKVYLHLDKEAYRAGEKIWYRAYLVDARTHKPDTISKNLIVEVLNSYGNISLVQLLKLENGFARGDFHIPDTLPEGLYQVRAYTNWMRNFGNEYFFRRDINIWNEGNYLNLYREDKIASKKHKRKSTRKARKIDVRFFPEGGYMIGGVESKIGFKAVNELGLGIPVEGTVYDKKNRAVAEFKSSHLGMGAFLLTPDRDLNYTAEVNIQGEKNLRFSLPEVQGSGYYMQLLERDVDGLKLKVGSTFENPTILVACHIRGRLLFESEVKPGPQGVIMDIPTGGFPGGIIHITLFDSNRQPRCERLAYIYGDGLINVSILQEKTVYGKMQEVELTLVARDDEGRPVDGSFSFSVSDRDLENNASDFQSGIVSSFHLASDIPGRIEQPDYYFRNRDAETRQALDHLLLTQGWRRFNWDNLINEVPLKIDYGIQKGLLVRGKVTREIFDIPLKNLPVTLTVLSEFNDVFITRTDNKGQYSFVLPDYEDTIQVEITARKPSGKKSLVIYLEEGDLEDSEEIFSSYSSEMIVRGTNTLKPIPEEPKDTMQQSLEGIYHSPDHVLYVDDHMRTYNSVLDMMQGRIPGVVVSGNSVQVRGPTSIYGSNEPLYLIDNIPTDVQAVQALNPMDIERIEVLKGPSAAIYGVRGANGVIAIFTRRGRFMIKGILKFEMLGYHKPQEFYSPVYGTQFDHLIIDDRSSLYWNPNLVTGGDGKARIRFYNSDRASTFYIVAEGLSPDGRVGRAEKSYRVE
jgi:TonB-dependent SusC/RagA subfamily outer membrane receptor